MRKFYIPELWRAIRSRKDDTMELTKEQAQEIMEQNEGDLDLYMKWGITALPDNLTVGGYLDLRGTGITALPDNLTVGGSLDLRGTGITALPDNLTVGGYLYLRGTGITALPDNLTVGGSLILDKRKERRKVKHLHNGDYVAGRYIFCDNILTHVKKVKQVGAYTLYIGKIPGRNVVSDGTNYAHCKKLRDGIADLAFKSAVNRGADQYKGMSLDTELTVAECVTMYRIITGACRQGSENFVNSLGELKEKYTIREAIELTRGQYNAGKFAEFFGEG